MRGTSRIVLLVGLLLSLLMSLTVGGPAGAQEGGTPGVTSFAYVRPGVDSPLCEPLTGGGANPFATYFVRADCIGVSISTVNTTADSELVVEFLPPGGGEPYTTKTPPGPVGATNDYDMWFRPMQEVDVEYPAGETGLRVLIDGVERGRGTVYINMLDATLAPVEQEGAKPYQAGQDVPLTGDIAMITNTTNLTTHRVEAPGAEFSLQVRTPSGEVRGPYGPFTAGPDGSISVTLPGEATAGLTAGAESGFKTQVGVDVIDASFTDPVTGDWGAAVAGTAQLPLLTEPSSLLLDASFVSSTGWTKPGFTYPFRVTVTNLMADPADGITVSVAPPPGAVFEATKPLQGAGTATVNSDGTITWNVGSLAAGSFDVPSAATMVVEARARTTAEDPRVVWKDLSTTATLTYDGGPGGITSTTHGPKVIPADENGNFDTARYGDKPFPVVPVDYLDRKHQAKNRGDVLSSVINSPDIPGSTFNLYQEMSFGQLFPKGAVPSVGIAAADFDYEPGFEFTSPTVGPNTSCRGATLGPAEPMWGTPAYSNRIEDGWYQLPGNTEYYGGDYPAFTLGVGSSIDSACGPISKSVYDAAVIADPEIDYDDFDGDKDGLVDFFMMVFVGCGGNGASQVPGLCPYTDAPYDNIWPHSSSLEFSYQDDETGLAGYISDDQLTSHEGVPQCWTSAEYAQYTDCAADGGSGQDDLPVYVRVGPYNVNPEDAIEHASVISHEYGHHLGLPDFYSSYSAYDDWNLMAADYSQHMTIFSKQELGWVVPRFLQPGESVTVTDWEEIKNDTGEIEWVTPSGEPYTLSAANGDQNIHNSESYGLKLPRELIIDPALVEEQASAPWLWWSGRGNDFGCPPRAGHNLDINLPEVADLPAGTPVELRFRSAWDIEWDWDYGFVMITDDGETYATLPSEEGYTTDNTYNPNSAECFARWDNGLTGQSGFYAQGEPFVTAARNPAENDYSAPLTFLDDAYDLTALSGQDVAVVRFSYFTDPAFDRPGWFVDDLEVVATIDGEEQVLYSSDFSEEDELRLFPGGCGDEGMKVAKTCTAGWHHLKADSPAALDHGYYLELRDRSGFDYLGRGQSDRGDLSWIPGVLIEYTDESHGYGNNGVPQPPAQHYLDSQPQPGYDCDGSDPIDQQLGGDNCVDAAFTMAEEDTHFDDDPNDEDGVWVDNFDDPQTESGFWEFGYDCLTLDVTAMDGDTSNSEALPSDLTADAVISAGPGCERFTYGQSAGGLAPIAVAQAKPTEPAVGEDVTFDGSRSSDDEPSTLAYSWDFGDGATADGQTVRHAYRAAGTYTATLTVVDADGNAATDTIEITVGAAPGGGSPLPSTGGGLALLGLLALAGAWRLRRA